MTVPVIVLALVFLLIAVRQVGRLRLQIWQVMLGGAVAVLATGQISPADAARAIDFDVIFFLFGMFVVGQALEESGYLSHLAYVLFRSAKSVDHLVLLVLFGIGLASAFLMNDTLAIVGTPVVLLLAKKHGVSAKLMLLTLAFAVTIGSATSPIGNPQNLLVAIGGNVPNPFVTFARYLLAPTLVNLFLAYMLLRVFFRKDFRAREIVHAPEPISDRRLAALAKVSLALLVLLIAAKVALVFLKIDVDFRLTYIALAAALPVLLLSRKRFAIARKIDWHTLVFFAAMFVLMDCVWRTGTFQSVMDRLRVDIASTAMIFLVSVVLSQLISNVPLVALYMPMLLHAGSGVHGMMALAAGSTIAGNFFILGAASNVIIIQNAEKKHGETLTFTEFARVGVPLTIVNVAAHWLFLSLI
ncbi:MAG: SLC13 family permease [Planctomycetota bacterium]|nr:SLC13 family permease [Planctomycetota bacterium]